MTRQRLRVVRVIGSGHAHKKPTPSLMQARRSAYGVYVKCMEEEKARKEKDMQQKAKTDNEDRDTQNIQNNWNLESGHFQKSTKASQRNRQHDRKSCAQKNAPFMKQIRDYKMPSTLKTWVK